MVMVMLLPLGSGPKSGSTTMPPKMTGPLALHQVSPLPRLRSVTFTILVVPQFRAMCVGVIASQLGGGVGVGVGLGVGVAVGVGCTMPNGSPRFLPPGNSEASRHNTT